MAKFNANQNNTNPNQEPEKQDTTVNTKKSKKKKIKTNKNNKGINLKPILKSKKVVIALSCVALLGVGYGVYNLTTGDRVEQALKDGKNANPESNGFKVKDTDDTTKSKDDSNKVGDNSNDYFKENKIFETAYIPTETSEDGRQGSVTYLNPKMKSLTSLTLMDLGKPLSEATKVSTTKLYGFAAFKNEKTNTWIRIPYIQPIPEVEVNYETFGGTDKNTISKEIESRHSKADKLLEDAKKANTKPELDTSDIAKTKETDPTLALENLSTRLEENAKEFVTPLKFYTQDSFNLPLTGADMDKINDGYYMNILDQKYYGLVTKQSVDKLNSVNQNLATQMLNNWGLEATHDIYVFQDKSYIVIDGIAYKYSSVVLDLYDNPNAESNNRTNVLDSTENRPSTNNYKTSIMVENSENE